MKANSSRRRLRYTLGAQTLVGQFDEGRAEGHPKGSHLGLSRVTALGGTHLLQQTFPTRGTIGILEVRRGKLFTPPVPASIGPLLHGEAAAFVEIWRQLDGPAPVAAVS